MLNQRVLKPRGVNVSDNGWKREGGNMPLCWLVESIIIELARMADCYLRRVSVNVRLCKENGEQKRPYQR